MYGDIPQPSVAGASGDRSEAGKVGDVHAGQQSSLLARRSSRGGCREPTRPDYAASADSGGCTGQPARRPLWDGAGGQGAGGGIRHGGDVSEGQRGLWPGGLPAGGGYGSRRSTEMRKIISKYAQNGVPADLVDAAKRARSPQAEFQRNSIPGLADVWSDALAAEGRNSPDEDIDAIAQGHAGRCKPRREAISVRPTNSITATLKPVPTGEPVAGEGIWRAEKVTSAPTKPVDAAGRGRRVGAGGAQGAGRLHRRSPTRSCPTGFG